jgi:hypothetical protein
MTASLKNRSIKKSALQNHAKAKHKAKRFGSNQNLKKTDRQKLQTKNKKRKKGVCLFFAFS